MPDRGPTTEPSVLFQPHSDDAALFSAYACLAHDPLVVTVLRSQLQEDRGTGITAATREAEDNCALAELGVTEWLQWPYPDVATDWGAVENAMSLLDERVEPVRVFAPAPELLGHFDHNAVGNLAANVFGDRVTGYMTYRRGEGRSYGTLVEMEPEWVSRKLRALACYRSQIAEPSTRPWFVELFDVREWVAG